MQNTTINSSSFTNEARDNHLDMCVATTMENMADTHTCVGYFAGMAAGNPELRNVTIADFRDQCLKNEQTFTVGDAEKICKSKIEGSMTAWSDVMNANGSP